MTWTPLSNAVCWRSSTRYWISRDGDRERWLAEHHSTEPELLRALQRLLASDRQHAQALPTAVPQARLVAPDLPPPARVGVYRVVSLLGRGGMGQVYLGERDDGLFEQKVAIKLMSPGLFPAAAAELFDNERRLLARLRHRNIAQLYDGGVTPEGRPFFVMELIGGEPLDQYCAQHKLSLTQTIALFLDACAAVRHAHLNLVVHADLKPSNILVDGEGQVKLLDFGIARLQLGSAQGQTATLPAPLTLAYASPQRREREAPVPADDVYALGVTLFELLTGTRPPDASGNPATANASVRALSADLTAISSAQQRPRRRIAMPVSAN